MSRQSSAPQEIIDLLRAQPDLDPKSLKILNKRYEHMTDDKDDSK